MLTTEELQEAEARYQRASRVAEEARLARNATIHTAIATGMPHFKIAAATGLTRARIGQLAQTVKTASP